MAVSMDTFSNGTNFFSNALAGLVLYRYDYLKTCETQSFESIPTDELYCGSSNALPFLTSPDPIAEVSKVMFPVDLIDGTATKKGIVFRIEYDEVIFDTFRPHPVSGVKP
jgi:hypothetical protein